MHAVTVSLAKAVICFQGLCHPALVGVKTPTGVFQLRHLEVVAKGYGGDVLEFHEDARYLWAIHRVWRLNPKQHRLERLLGNDPKRRVITMGCINIEPVVYQALVDCCSNATLTIVP